MPYCPVCHKDYDTTSLTCPDCGTPFAPAAVVIDTDIPVVQPVSKAKAITGMALSGVGLFLALPTTIYAVLSWYPVFAFFSFLFIFLGFPCSIVGLVMSKQNLKNGDTSIFSKLGKGFGTGGVIAFSILAVITCLFFLGFIGCVGCAGAGSFFSELFYLTQLDRYV